MPRCHKINSWQVIARAILTLSYSTFIPDLQPLNQWSSYLPKITKTIAPNQPIYYFWRFVRSKITLNTRIPNFYIPKLTKKKSWLSIIHNKKSTIQRKEIRYVNRIHLSSLLIWAGMYFFALIFMFFL